MSARTMQEGNSLSDVVAEAVVGITFVVGTAGGGWKSELEVELEDAF